MTPLSPKFDLATAIAKHSENALLFDNLGTVDIKMKADQLPAALSFSASFDQANRPVNTGQALKLDERPAKNEGKDRPEQAVNKNNDREQEQVGSNDAGGRAPNSDIHEGTNDESGELSYDEASEGAVTDDAISTEDHPAATALLDQSGQLTQKTEKLDSEKLEGAPKEFTKSAGSHHVTATNTPVGKSDGELVLNEAEITKVQTKDLTNLTKSEGIDKPLKDLFAKQLNIAEKLGSTDDGIKSVTSKNNNGGGEKVDALGAMLNAVAGKSAKKSISREGEIPKLQVSTVKTATSAVLNSTGSLAKGAVDTGKITLPMTVKIGQPQWAGQLAERTAWLASQKITSADIQLDPPELGPIAVKVHIQNDQASVSFVSANQSVREALDQSQMRLKELFEGEGMDLVDVDVSDHSKEESGDGEDEALAGGAAQANDGENDEAAQLTLEVSSGIDHFV